MAHHLDDVTAERILRGDLVPDDAPPAYGRVARLLAAARAGADGLALDATLVAAVVEAIDSSPAPAGAVGWRSRVPARLMTAKAAAAFAVVALSASGAAAATGSLPEAAQNGLAKVAGHIGISLPSSADDGARAVAEDAGRAGRGTDGGGAGSGGAEGVGGGEGSAADHGAEVSDTARTTGSEGADKGEEVSDAARDGHGPVDADHRAGPPAPATAVVTTAAAGPVPAGPTTTTTSPAPSAVPGGAGQGPPARAR